MLMICNIHYEIARLKIDFYIKLFLLQSLANFLDNVVLYMYIFICIFMLANCDLFLKWM